MEVASSTEPVNPVAIVVRVDVDHRSRVATYLVARDAFRKPTLANFYAHAGRLQGDLQALAARDSPTEGSLIDRVERHARTVAAEPNLEAAIGFSNGKGETGLVRVTSVRQDVQPKN